MRSRKKKFGIALAGADSPRCSACGSSVIRTGAKYCLICGKILNEGYLPLDALRSSNRMQGRSFLMENARGEEITDLFELNRNTVSEVAWACFVYSLVPYLGILFVPATFVIGALGVGLSVRNPKSGGRKLSLLSLGLSVIVLFVQIGLWWLLYIIPAIGRRV